MSSISGKKIAFIGAGFMGRALIAGLINSGKSSKEDIVAVDLSADVRALVKKECGVKTSEDGKSAIEKSDVVVLAVKPQVMEKVLEPLKESFRGVQLVISVAAGVKISSLKKWLADGVKIVRAMPNMGSSVGEGACAICTNGDVDKGNVSVAKDIFDASGKCVVVEEHQMDSVTALSGSGPAYVFLFLSALTDAGVKCGLEKGVSFELALKTLQGAGKLVESTGEDPDELIKRITSPGGTTLAGLSALDDADFRGAVMKGVSSAMKRSKELGES